MTLFTHFSPLPVTLSTCCSCTSLQFRIRMVQSFTSCSCALSVSHTHFEPKYLLPLHKQEHESVQRNEQLLLMVTGMRFWYSVPCFPSSCCVFMCVCYFLLLMPEVTLWKGVCVSVTLASQRVLPDTRRGWMGKRCEPVIVSDRPGLLLLLGERIRQRRRWGEKKQELGIHTYVCM